MSQAQTVPTSFPIIGIGASAGGLEAFGTFFQAMPPANGMAFVLVQHLPPQRDSMLADILSKHTSMPVMQVEDGLAVQPNHVYVIRPGHTMTIVDGHLRLGAPVEDRGHRRPVDDFFRSLAHEKKEKSIALIFSGMGSNGTAGAQEIKSAGGICIAQDPESAQFPSMPQSLIHAGLADQILAPEKIPELLLKYVHHPYMMGSDADETAAQNALRLDRHHFNEILALLRTRTNYEFGGYKKPTLHRRIQRRMGVAQITSLEEYVQLLRQKPEEISALATDLMINVTGFFRDAEAWEALRTQAVAPLVDNRTNGQPIRVWVTACATGEEAYSMAMLITEEAERVKKRFDVKIFATDAGEASLAHARNGIFAGGIEGDVSVERLDRFFDKQDQVYRVKKEIREMVVFAPHNLLNDPPFSRLDIASCRNLLIYLEPQVQRRVIALLHFSLREGAFLFLGNSETIGTAEQLFQPINKKWRIYRRIGPSRQGVVGFAQMSSPRGTELRDRETAESLPQAPLASAIQKTLLDRYTPPAVVIDRRFKIIYFHGATPTFLSQPAGEPTSNLLNMCGDGLRAAVRAACREAMTDNRMARVSDGRIETKDGPRRIQVVVSPLGKNWAQDHFLVCFEEVLEAPPLPLASSVQTAGDSTSLDIARQLEEELRNAREELQSTIEEMESSNEELKASNEEVTSINEELQSTNEELETSKEELQSLNEELTTVNGQLQTKIEELEGTTNDLSNLLSSTNIAVVFLDTKCRIRRYTPAVKDLIELIPSDVGRPLSDLAPKFNDNDLMADTQLVLDTLIPIEREVPSHSNAWYLRRALPYRTADNRIDGVVITFVDITERKSAEQHVRSAYDRLQSALDQLPAAVLIVDVPSGKLTLVNQQVSRLFRHPYPFPFLGADWPAMFSIFKSYRPDGQPQDLQNWPLARSLRTGETVVDEEIEFDRLDGTRGIMSASSAPVLDNNGNRAAVVAAFWEITQRKLDERHLIESEERFRLLVDGAKDFAIFLIDEQGKVATWNQGGERLLGYTAAEIIGKPVAQLFTHEDRAAGQPEIEQATATREGRAADIRWHIRKDGTRFWANGTTTRLDKDASGKSRGFVKVLRDDTEAKIAAESLRRSKQVADESRLIAENANHAKDEFVATVSHELRTPLSAILLWAKMLSHGRGSDKELMNGLDIILRSASSQQQLIEDLLDVSRMTTGKLRITLRATNLAQAVHGAMQAIVPIADNRGVTVTSEIASVGVVRADPDRLQQVVWNLLNNAVKFTPAGGKVHLKLHRKADHVFITVTDTGIGIHQDFIPNIFERFSQAESGSTRQHSGLGIGLTIARQLVELHNGTINVASEGDGKGATFIVTLPLPEIPVDPNDADSGTVLESDQGEGLLKNTRVLLVEDEPNTRDAVQVFLERQGAHVFPAQATAIALKIFAESRPDLIISDIAMPGEDGYSLIRQIREMEKKQKLSPTPAVAMTAFVREDDRDRARTAGFQEHLSKPVDPNLLMAVITRLLQKA